MKVEVLRSKMSFLIKNNYYLQKFIAVVGLICIDLFVATDISSTKQIMQFLHLETLRVDLAIYSVLILLCIVALISKKMRLLDTTLFVTTTLMTLLLIGDVILLVYELPKENNGMMILFNSFLIWLTNLVIFSIWYWNLDRGGVNKRHPGVEPSISADLVYPQEESKLIGWKSWKPSYLDYLYLSFYSSMAFTPTDTLVLSQKMKFLLMIQASLSLVVLAMIAARAISIIH